MKDIVQETLAEIEALRRRMAELEERLRPDPEGKEHKLAEVLHENFCIYGPADESFEDIPPCPWDNEESAVKKWQQPHHEMFLKKSKQVLLALGILEEANGPERNDP